MALSQPLPTGSDNQLPDVLARPCPLPSNGSPQSGRQHHHRHLNPCPSRRDQLGDESISHGIIPSVVEELVERVIAVAAADGSDVGSVGEPLT